MQISLHSVRESGYLYRELAMKVILQAVKILGFLLLMCIGCDRTLYVEMTDYELLSDAELDELIETGLKAWNTPGIINGGSACVHCHSPDGIDLAYANYSDFSIRRRGAQHVGPGIETLNAGKLEDIVSMVRALQVKHRMALKNPNEFRPFQPGEIILPGNTDAEKDAAFGQNLRDMGFRFASIPVLSSEEAYRQIEEWHTLLLHQIPVGIEFNKWSEDPYYHHEVNIFADWIPMLPFQLGKDKQEEWKYLQVAYLENPGTEQFKELFGFIWVNIAEPVTGNIAELEKNKYASHLIGQHLFRKGDSDDVSADVNKLEALLEQVNNATYNSINPFWAIGEFFDKHKTLDSIDLPETVIQRFKDRNTKKLALPWYWLGWIADPDFKQTTCNANISCNNILYRHLFNPDENTKRQLPIHALFMSTKFNTEKIFNEQLTSSGMFTLPEIESIHFAEYGHQFEIYSLMVENSIRMFLYLMEDHLEKNTPLQIQHISDWLNQLHRIEVQFREINSIYLEENLKLIEGIRNELTSRAE